MKQNIRRIIAVLCMAVCLLGLTACGAGEAETKDSLDPMEAAQVNQDAQEWLSIIVSVTPEDAEEKQAGFMEVNLNGVAEAIAAWINVSGDTGDLVQVENAVAEKTEDGGYTSTMRAQFENRPVEVKIFYEIQNNVLTPVSVSIAPEYTTGENMARAAMNTLMGMGTVFLVLIFISLIISCFKYINAFEQKMKAAPRAAAPAAVVAPAASQPQEELVDDLELVAVITAAIAAATGSSADGLVVRSIRRAPGAKWKRA